MADLEKKTIMRTPLTVTVCEDETEDQFLERWNKVDSLPEIKKQLLFSDFTIEQIERIVKRFQLSIESANEISRLVRLIVFTEMDFSQIGPYLKKRIRNFLPAEEDEISAIIAKIILQQPSSFIDNEKVEAIKCTLDEALLKYAKLGEQIISKNSIKLTIFPEPVRPSIKNWIKDFHESMGAGKHSPIDRGNYLFHGENGKKLTAPERQKLGMILKSLDEQTLLTIDPQREVIVFDVDNNLDRKNTESQNTIHSSDHGLGSSLDSRLHGNDNTGYAKTWIPDQVRNDMVSGEKLMRNDNIAVERKEYKPQTSQEQRKVVDLRPAFMSRPSVAMNVAENVDKKIENPEKVNPVGESNADSRRNLYVPSIPHENEDRTPNENGRINLAVEDNNYPKRNVGRDFDSEINIANVAKKEDSIEKFYAPKPAGIVSVEKAPSNLQIQTEKPPVVLKNISFSPNFVAMPKPESAKQENVLNHERIAKLVSQPIAQIAPAPIKEEIFSVPGSKPPMGTEEYDARKINVKPAPNFQVPQIESPAHKAPVVNQVNVTTEEPKKSLQKDIDLDLLSDEMLLKMYKERSVQKKPASPNPNSQRYHIEPLHAGNVVNLKN